MKAKTSTDSKDKAAKPAVKVQDLKPKTDPVGGSKKSHLQGHQGHKAQRGGSHQA